MALRISPGCSRHEPSMMPIDEARFGSSSVVRAGRGRPRPAELRRRELLLLREGVSCTAKLSWFRVRVKVGVGVRVDVRVGVRVSVRVGVGVRVGVRVRLGRSSPRAAT
eukprot:scaffold17787_cov56-Phaeocystis_antarctica.AAC.2